jgi:hypothetical protein
MLVSYHADISMDIIVDYGREQFIIELKIWHGDTEHKAAYDQLAGYLRSKVIWLRLICGKRRTASRKRLG